MTLARSPLARVLFVAAFLPLSFLLLGFGDDPNGAIPTKTRSIEFAGRPMRLVVVGSETEGRVQRLLEHPLSLRISDDQGQAHEGLRVVFRLLDGNGAWLENGGEHLRRAEKRSNAKGLVKVYLRLGKVMGDYRVEASIYEPGSRVVGHVETFRVTAMDAKKIFFWIFGGLGLFLFGMNKMSEGMRLLAGKRLKRVLELFTRRRIVALAVGAGVTALIQSSSATTVMLVGFVNAGLMTFRQTIAVIFGANVGTTITGQLIAFKLTSVALPAIGLGVLMTMLSRTRRSQYIGQTVLGFGLLFLGMKTMSDVFVPIRHSPMVQQAFVTFCSSPIMAVFVGALVTMVLQSSSATVGLTITLATAGFIDFTGAAGLVFGENIGTTITAVLASLSANLAAKRTALIHMLFNTAGALIMLICLYVPYAGHPIYLHFVDWVTPGEVFAPVPENIARHVANAHSIFNVLFAFAFLPFTGLFARLAEILLPGRQGQVHRLAPNLVSTPSLAMGQAVREMHRMGAVGRSMMRMAMEGFFHKKDEDFTRIYEYEDRVDEMQHEITDYLVLISQQDLSLHDSEKLPRLLHSCNDFERVGDLSINVVELAQRAIDRDLPFSEEAIAELRRLLELVERQFASVLEAMENQEDERAREALQVEKEVNRLWLQYRKNNVKRMRDGGCTTVAGIVYLDLLTTLEKIGDHLENVAKAIVLAGPHVMTGE